MSGRLIGSLVGASFGLVFLLVNSGGLPALWPLVVRVVAAAAAVAFVALVVRGRRRLFSRGDEDSAKPFGGWFWLILAVEVVALFGGRLVLGRFVDLAVAGVAWTTLVVGAHFFPMARVTGMRMFLALAAALTPLGVIGLALAFAGSAAWPVALISGVGAGLVLLVFAIRGVAIGEGATGQAAGQVEPGVGVR
ncbi:hypothetical protein [Mariniluteicoccus flavus]